MNIFKARYFFLLFLTFFPIGLTAQTEIKHQPSSKDSSISYLTTFELQMMKFNRMLRTKYNFADSVATFWPYSPEQQLYFNILSGKFLDFDTKFPVFPELYLSTWENELRKRAYGGSEHFLMNPVQVVNAFINKPEWEQSKRAFRNNFIPSNLQLNVLSVLWQESTATQTDIYLGIDKEILITAQDLDEQLQKMVDLGLVERKMISPQQTFTILSPLKSYQIEMSSKNRKNRVYLYRTKVEKNNMLQFLLARYSRVKEEGIGNPKELRRLIEKLKIVSIEDKG